MKRTFNSLCVDVKGVLSHHIIFRQRSTLAENDLSVCTGGIGLYQTDCDPCQCTTKTDTQYEYRNIITISNVD